ncbi:hypothetical protein ACFY19_00705 [Streptosporangium saharense]|uniref:hypothetical protein n=1 Tax=Streptosporangium saharense TaxID=1706840 RepID=UPI0036CBB733
MEVPLAVPRPAAVLFDRDGTLIADVPHNADPFRVRPMPGAPESFATDPALARRTGEAARTAALARYGLARFLADWDLLLGKTA